MIELLKNLLFKNPGLKIGSLFLAVIVWFAIHGEAQIEAFITIDVQLKNRPTNLIITNAVTDKIHLRIRGSRTQIKKVQEQPPDPYEIDLANTESGSALFRVFSFDFTLPRGVQITRINPQLITVELEQQESKELPVRIAFSGSLERGFVIVSKRVTPSSVTVAGAKSAMRTLSAVHTEEVQLNGLREGFSRTLRLALSSSGNIWLDGPEEAQVDIEIEEQLLSEMIDTIPITVKGQFKSVTIKPQQASLMLQCPAGLLHDLRRQPPLVFLNADKIQVAQGSSRTVNLKLRYQVPDSCKVLKSVPALVQATLSR